MPERRSWRSARSSSGSVIRRSPSVGLAIDEIAVVGELADERIDLAERERRGGAALEVAADEAVRRDAELERGGARVVDGGDAVLLGEREHAEDAAHTDGRRPAAWIVAQSAPIAGRRASARAQELLGTSAACAAADPRRASDAAARLPPMLAQELAGAAGRGGARALVPLHGSACRRCPGGAL